MHPGCRSGGLGQRHQAAAAFPGADDEEEEGERKAWGHEGQQLDGAVTPSLCSMPMQDVDAAAIKVQVCVYAFDLLYLNGEVSVCPQGDDTLSLRG